jgi:three-Cys-motif partner protein
MSSFKPTKLWEASPHTLAKLEIIERYLYLWFTIVGSNSNNQRLAYIDGFAGPGRYTNTDKSSPLIALQAAKKALDRFGWNWPTCNRPDSRKESSTSKCLVWRLNLAGRTEPQGKVRMVFIHQTLL